MSSRMNIELVLKAFWMAVLARKPQSGLLFHSDRSSQYTSEAFAKAIASESQVVLWVGR